MSDGVRLLVCCDSFKGSISAEVACGDIVRSLRGFSPRLSVASIPLADGGEGTLGVLARNLMLPTEPVVVTGPRGTRVTARVAWATGAALARPEIPSSGKVAVVEVADCAGLTLVASGERDPMHTTSYGLGELLGHVAGRNAQAVIVGLGGSATVDGGIGMLQALGASLVGVSRPAVGQDLLRLSRVGLSSLRRDVSSMVVIAACDVKNPLLGDRGAALAFGPQKGASALAARRLEEAMLRYTQLIAAESLGAWGSDGVETSEGTGAAGGLGYALAVALNARLLSGIELVLDATQFDVQLSTVDVVVTGEGCLDRTSFEGKVISGVLGRAQRRRLPVHVICGTTTLDESEWRDRGISSVTCLTEFAVDRADAMSRSRELLGPAVRRMMTKLEFCA